MKPGVLIGIGFVMGCLSSMMYNTQPSPRHCPVCPRCPQCNACPVCPSNSCPQCPAPSCPTCSQGECKASSLSRAERMGRVQLTSQERADWENWKENDINWASLDKFYGKEGLFQYWAAHKEFSPDKTLDENLKIAEEKRVNLVYLPWERPTAPYRNAHGHKDPYSRSPQPISNGLFSMVREGVWVCLEDAVFAYDTWFENSHFYSWQTWLGTTCQQDANSAWAIQEMLWNVKPDLVIEIGTNSGGGTVFYRSIMNNYNADAKIVTMDVVQNPRDWDAPTVAYVRPDAVLGSDHPMWHEGVKKGTITFLCGNIGENKTFANYIYDNWVSKASNVLVIDDGSHWKHHTVANAGNAWRWVTKGSYYVTQDTKMDRHIPSNGAYVMGAVDELYRNQEFKDAFRIDRSYEKTLYTQHHRGFHLRQ